MLASWQRKSKLRREKRFARSLEVVSASAKFAQEVDSAASIPRRDWHVRTFRTVLSPIPATADRD